MANAVTSSSGTVVGTAVTFKVPNARQGAHLYIKYDKGNGTQATMVLEVNDPNLHATDLYKPIYLDGENVRAQAYIFDTTANYRVPVPLVAQEKTLKATVTFADGTTQTFAVEIRQE